MVQHYGAVLPVSRNGYVPVCAFRMGTVSPNYDRYPTRLPVTDLQHRRKAFFVGIFCLGFLLLLFCFFVAHLSICSRALFGTSCTAVGGARGSNCWASNHPSKAGRVSSFEGGEGALKSTTFSAQRYLSRSGYWRRRELTS